MMRRRQLTKDRLIDDRDDEADPRLRDDRPDPRGGDGPPFDEGEGEQEDADGEPYLHRQPDGRMVIARTRRRRR
jgi:hypothetical protein